MVEAEEMKRESQRHSSELQMQNHELRHQNDILGMKLQHAQRRHSEVRLPLGSGFRVQDVRACSQPPDLLKRTDPRGG